LPSQDRATLSGRIARLVVEVIHDLNESQGPQSLPSGLYMTGGDLVAGLMGELGVQAFEVGGEVVPLAVQGHFSGGQLDGTPAVAKGGHVGAASTLVECLA